MICNQRARAKPSQAAQIKTLKSTQILLPTPKEHIPKIESTESWSKEIETGFHQNRVRSGKSGKFGTWGKESLWAQTLPSWPTIAAAVRCWPSMSHIRWSSMYVCQDIFDRFRSFLSVTWSRRGRKMYGKGRRECTTNKRVSLRLGIYFTGTVYSTRFKTALHIRRSFFIIIIRDPKSNKFMSPYKFYPQLRAT